MVGLGDEKFSAGGQTVTHDAPRARRWDKKKAATLAEPLDVPPAPVGDASTHTDKSHDDLGDKKTLAAAVEVSNVVSATPVCGTPTDEVNSDEDGFWEVSAAETKVDKVACEPAQWRTTAWHDGALRGVQTVARHGIAERRQDQERQGPDTLRQEHDTSWRVGPWQWADAWHGREKALSGPPPSQSRSHRRRERPDAKREGIPRSGVGQPQHLVRKEGHAADPKHQGLASDRVCGENDRRLQDMPARCVSDKGFELESSTECVGAQREEREILEAIYASELEVLSDSEWLVHIDEQVTLRVYLPAQYPCSEPPTPLLEGVPDSASEHLVGQLLGQWVPGEGCVHQWADHLRNEMAHLPLQEQVCQNDAAVALQLQETEMEEVVDRKPLTAFTYEPAAPQYGQRPRVFAAETSDPGHTTEIIHGEPIVDRKSTFQAHLAIVTSMQQVHWTHRQLLSDKKIAAATHNIIAYRFRDEARNVLCSDNDDDGETAAGGRLAELLQLRGALGVFVMVSRWFGGIQLGTDRFKHINRAAQLLLDSAGVSRHGEATTKTSRKGR